VFAIAFVWVTEAMNTAVEELCDFVSPGFAYPIGRVKDLAAGAVLAASLAAAVIKLLTLTFSVPQPESVRRRYPLR
jgi:diacylglycerol kinase (ATP)